MKHGKKRESKPAGGTALERFVRCVELPEYAAGTDECIEILGGNTVQVEGARGIHTYEPELIRLHMKNHLLVLQGSEFDLVHFGSGTIRVTGKLRQINWEQ